MMMSQSFGETKKKFFWYAYPDCSSNASNCSMNIKVTNGQR